MRPAVFDEMMSPFMDLSIGTFESIDQQIKYAEEMIAQFEH